MMETVDWVFRLRNIRKTYPNAELDEYALNIDELDIPKNRVIAIIGESGSGKTTLLNLLGMLDEPDAQNFEAQRPTILYGGNGDGPVPIISEGKSDAAALNRLRKKAFGFVFQEGYLLRNLQCASNIKVPLYLNRLDISEDNLQSLLEEVGLNPSDEYACRLPTELSGGQSQRVAIVRSVVHNPEVILADEPSSRLDHDRGIKVMELLTSWCKGEHGRTLIWVTHNLEHAARFGDQIICIRDGAVLFNRENKDHRTETVTGWIRESMQQAPAEPDEPVREEEAPGQWKNTAIQSRSSGWMSILKFIFFFAIWDIFPRTKSKSGESGNILSFLAAKARAFLGIRKTQGLNILSLLIILVLTLFFFTISTWLKNYFVFTVSDPRINSVTVKGKKRGDAMLDARDMKRLSTLAWASEPNSFTEVLSWEEEIETKKLKVDRPAILGAYGSRDRPFDFYLNNEGSSSFRFSDVVPLTLAIMNVQDPILSKITLLEGSEPEGLKPGDKYVDSLLRGADGKLVDNKAGVILTYDSLTKDLGYLTKVPKTVKMDLNNEDVEVPVLGVADWLPFSASAILTEGWYEEQFLKRGPGDPLPGYERITVYINNMLEEGIPLADTLVSMGYQTSEDIKSRLSWIINLTDFISYTSIIAVACIGLLVCGTLMVSYTQAIRKKQNEIGVLLAHGTSRSLLKLVFMFEIVVVWLIATAMAWPAYQGGTMAFKRIMTDKFDLGPDAIRAVFSIPAHFQAGIVLATLVLACAVVWVAVNKIIRGPIAETLKSVD